MTALDDLPAVTSFLGLDLKTASFIIAAMGIVHPMAYGCTFFMPISYLVMTIWILVGFYMVASIGLVFGINTSDELICAIWIWYAVIFVVLMMMMMTLMALVFTSRHQKKRVLVIILGMLWYIGTVYFILVVNSYRKQLVKGHQIALKLIEKIKVRGDDSISRDYIMTPINPENILTGYITDDFPAVLSNGNRKVPAANVIFSDPRPAASPLLQIDPGDQGLPVPEGTIENSKPTQSSAINLTVSLTTEKNLMYDTD